ncbi:hypothetical protein DYB28_009048 [Aphanomyces astaci]|uniref:RxLR effector protein n=1 Tax=Aphanomyces astaci TaxID=112090 RepID=A0A9X8DK82_APHAT|nr:hypothetical protein DYB28_009048 [Aphanomyces astaci]
MGRMISVVVVGVLAAAASSAHETSVPDCTTMINIAPLLYKDILANHQDEIGKCLGYSKFHAAIKEDRRPNREELALFFESIDCREIVRLLLRKVDENGSRCSLGTLGTSLGQLASLPFEDLKAIYAPFLRATTPAR